MSLPASATRSFFGWHVVAATFLLAAFGWGTGFYGPPVFLYAVVARTGWPVPMVSAAVTVHFLTGAVVVANLPQLYRRFGVPVVTVLGAVLLALGIAGWALAAEPWQLFAAVLASGAGWVAMGVAAVNALIAPWFILRRPAALGMAHNGASLGGVIFSPRWIALIAGIGFLPAALAVGGVMVAVVATLSVLVFRHTPESMGQRPDGEEGADPRPRAPRGGSPARRRFLRDRKFVTLAAGMMLGLFAQIGLLAHLFSLLVPVLGEGMAGLAMGGATLAAILGRSVVGWMMPVSADRRLVACASYGVQVAGSLLFLLAAGEGGARHCALRVGDRQCHLAAAADRAAGVHPGRGGPRRAADRRHRPGRPCLRSGGVRPVAWGWHDRRIRFGAAVRLCCGDTTGRDRLLSGGAGWRAGPPGAGVKRIEVGSDAPRRTSVRSHRTQPLPAGLAHPMLRGCILRSCR
ncbi:Major Facilitator Superfamily protein [Paracoccus pantotrophus]|nr:Major Facilitator Superfamily protein [Paracoccus pantotrophus]